MTAREIQRLLMSNRYLQSFTLPSYTPSRWFECDVVRFTKPGYMQEFEIKVTKADFWNDANKHRMVKALGSQMFLKHQLLAMGWHEGPSVFYYCIPEGLIPIEDVPSWAGLIEVASRNGRLYERIARRAPKLHTKKADPKIIDHARSVCYYRMHDLYQKHGKLLSKTSL